MYGLPISWLISFWTDSINLSGLNILMIINFLKSDIFCQSSGNFSSNGFELLYMFVHYLGLFLNAFANPLNPYTFFSS